MGQSSATKKYHQQMATNAQQQLALQQQQFTAMQTPTPEQKRFREGAANWETFIKGGDYSKPPAGEIINFDLWNPSRTAQMRDRLSNLTGIGAAAMGGTGDQSIAIQQQRERNVNLAAQDSANAYENAIKQTDNYYKGNGLAWSQQDRNTQANLLGNATNSSQYFFQQQQATLPPSFMQTFAPLLGGALSAGGQMLGAGFGAGGAFGCWIAEAIYGANDWRTHLVRAWLNTEFKKRMVGKAVMAVYMKFGKRVAAQVSKRNWLKRLAKPVFDLALNKALDFRHSQLCTS